MSFDKLPNSNYTFVQFYNVNEYTSFYGCRAISITDVIWAHSVPPVLPLTLPRAVLCSKSLLSHPGLLANRYFIFIIIIIFNKFIYLFIFGCVGSSLLHMGFL